MKQPNQIYYRRKRAGLCPECGECSGIWVYCQQCRAFPRLRVALAAQRTQIVRRTET